MVPVIILGSYSKKVIFPFVFITPFFIGISSIIAFSKEDLPHPDLPTITVKSFGLN